MQRVITSNNITFMDTSDERKLEVFISSNLPTSQIYNSNTGAYSPDWTTNNLILDASVFLDSIEKTDDATIQWNRKFGTGEEQTVGIENILTISTNELSDGSGIATYICTAQYDGITATSQMVFTRVDTGINGTDGVNGVDGTDGETYYTWVKYADDENGTNMSDDPMGKEYIGLAYNKNISTESNNANDYIWSLFKGSDGVDGKGISSIEEYYAISTSNSIAPDNNEFSTTVPTLTSTNKYLWNYEKITYTDGTNYTSAKRVIGAYGDSAIVYSMYVNTNVISKNTSNQYNPSVIKLEGKQKIGNNLLSDYSGRFKIEETSDMSSWASKYTSSTNESIKEYTPSENIKAIKCSMYQAGESGALLDYQIIPIVSDGSDSYTIVLSNESHTFAGSESAAIVGNATCEVIAYKGTERVAVTIGTISGCPTGMTTSISSNSTTSANFTVSVDNTMTTKSGMLTIPITVDEKSFTKYFSYSLALKGSDGTDGANGITFQIYGEQGLVLTSDTPSTVLKVFAYDGDTVITDAKYQWYYRGNVESYEYVKATEFNGDMIYYLKDSDGNYIEPETQPTSDNFNNGDYYILYNNNTVDWITINTDLTKDSYEVNRTDILKSASYKCKMTYKGQDYYSTVIVQDKNDIYDAVIDIYDTINTDDGKCYWVLYSTIYSEDGEVDSLLGPISTTAPAIDESSMYYYHVNVYDNDNNIVLKQVNSNRKGWEDADGFIGQEFDYIWNVSNNIKYIRATEFNEGMIYYLRDSDGNYVVPDTQPTSDTFSSSEYYILNENFKKTKVQIISSGDFTGTKNFVCEISNERNTLARPSIVLTDTSDPIISQTPPNKPKDGQIWIQKDNDGNYLVKTWIETDQDWVIVNNKTQIYTSCPTTYKVGDLWITCSDQDYFETCTWIKYADDASGTNMSDDPTGKTYIGLAFNKTTKTESENPSEYIWALVDSSDGILNGETYTWIKYADDELGTNMMDAPTDKTHIGLAYNKTSQIKSTESKDYIWSLIGNGDGVMSHKSIHLKGTFLKANKNNTVFDYNDWILASSKEDFSETTDYVNNLINFVSINDNGITIRGKKNNVDSEYSSNFTSDTLSFSYKEDPKLTINTEGIETPKAKVQDGLTVTNGPITLSSLNIKKESNGSYSFII